MTTINQEFTLKKIDSYYKNIQRITENRKTIIIYTFLLYGGYLLLIKSLISSMKHLYEIKFIAENCSKGIFWVLIVIIIHNHLNYILTAGKQFKIEEKPEEGLVNSKILSILSYFSIFWNYWRSLLIEYIALLVLILIVYFVNTYSISYLNFLFKS